MADDELRNAIDAIVARLQTDVQAQLSSFEARQSDARDAARRDAEAKAVEEWQAKLQAAVADAAADADRRIASESERLRSDAERALQAERDRTAAELETERLKARTLTTALDEARSTLQQERETARTLGESLLQARNSEVTEARASERQSQIALVDRLSSAVRSIGAGRSLSDTLNALATAAGSVAPRVALFVVNGPDLQGWRSSGFEQESPTSLRLPPGESEMLSTAATSGMVVSTATAQAPAFASLPNDRAALAVPITVGGQSVAVLYADDGMVQESEAPAAWPDAIQLLGSHASACLAYITALRTTQAMRAASGASARGSAGPGHSGREGEEDSSARRYARLLVSEIKLYNEAAVRMGREKRDLLHRLRPEIERAKRLYEERVSPSVGSRGVYFQQELVQTLADGDAALLGGMV